MSGGINAKNRKACHFIPYFANPMTLHIASASLYIQYFIVCFRCNIGVYDEAVKLYQKANTIE